MKKILPFAIIFALLSVIFVDDALAYFYYRRTVDWDVMGNQFGRQVASAGDVNGDGYTDGLVLAPFHNNGQNNEGAVFLYYGELDDIEASSSWFAESNVENGKFILADGSGDINGDGYDDVMVGMPEYASGSEQGLVVIWYGSPTGPLQPIGNPMNANVTISRPGAISNQFGSSVAIIGDINNDGFDDFAVGDPWEPLDLTITGEVNVYLGGINPSTSPVWHARGDTESTFTGGGFGSYITSGDINGDGFIDLLVGASFFHNARGNVYAWYGGSTGNCDGTGIARFGECGTEANADWHVFSDPQSKFGQSIATGDFDRDGYNDVLVGSLDFSNGETREGAAFFFFGSPVGPNNGDAITNADWHVESNRANARFARKVDMGDSYADHLDDIVIGDSENFGSLGAVHVWYGNTSRIIPNVADDTFVGNSISDRLGYSLVILENNMNRGDDLLAGEPFKHVITTTSNDGGFSFFAGIPGIIPIQQNF